MGSWLALAYLLAAGAPQMSREEAVDLARETLRRELELDEDVPLVSRRVEAVEWPDSSLGCPEPATVYLPVVVPGYRVLLQQADRFYEVHVGDARAVVCDRRERGGRSDKPLPERVPQPVPSEEGENDPVPEALLRSVLQDLAERLGVAEDAIRVESTREVTWDDGSLGCPEPGMSYTQALVEGYRIVLAHADETYDYHAARSGFFLLCEEERFRRR